jgi:hypothetical protein
MHTTVTEFGAQIAALDARLKAVGEIAATREMRPGGWRGTEILGHLIDSALNNHLRFVRAALEGAYEGPGYDQAGWVALHGYAGLRWHELLDQWRAHNRLLARIVERIPETQLGAECRVAGGAPVTLAVLIDDYVRHLGHHVDQIETLSNSGTQRG